ncbi:MAG: endonuclease/exonuclease/phosphatase family protein, partial [Verrucomicrobiota bacterium]
MKSLVQLKGLIQASVALVVLFIILGLFAEHFWVFDLFTHFQIQYAVCLLIAAVALLLLREKRWALAAFIFGVLMALKTVHYWLPYYNSEGSGKYRLLIYNVLTSNEQYEQVASYLHQSDADVILILEVNRKWIEQLKTLRANYPYRIEQSREDNFGILLLSRKEILNGNVLSFTSNGIPSVSAEIALSENEVIHLIGTHPIPPLGQMHTEMRNRHLMNVVDHIVQMDASHVMLVGDFNLTPFSPIFTSLLEKTELLDSGRGFGWQPTWFAKMPWFAIPI